MPAGTSASEGTGVLSEGAPAAKRPGPARAQSRGGRSAKPVQGRSAGHKITEFYSKSTDGDKGELNRLNGSQIFNEYIIYNKNGPFE